jgi:hypothetical protein
MHDQIFSHHLITYDFLNFLCYFMNGQKTIGMNHFPNFLDFLFSYDERRPGVSLYSSWPSSKRLYYSWFCPKTLLFAFRKSPKSFP